MRRLPGRRHWSRRISVIPASTSDGMMAGTVQGNEVAIGTMAGVTVDGAKVVQADIEASNGVIHVIDGVILPQ